MRAHKNEHILEEDEGILNGQSEQQSGQKSPCEEVGGVDDSPLAALVNSQQQGVEACFGLLNLEHLESAEND